jgi:hypothetical protein
MIHDNPHVVGLTVVDSHIFNKLPLTTLAQHMDNAGLSNIYNNSNVYLIELFFFINDLDRAFKLISNENLEKLQKGIIPLLVYFPHEGVGFNSFNNWFLKLHQLLGQYNLHNTKKFLVYGRNLDPEIYNLFLLDHNLNISFLKVFDIDFFETLFYTVIKKLDIPAAIFSNHKTVDFLSFNGRMRIHRLLLVSELTRRNLMNNIVSFLGYTDDIQNSYTVLINGINQFYPEIDKKIIEHLNQYVDNHKSIMVDGSEVNDINRFITDNKFYARSYFSLVTETGIDHSIRITEKIYKPIFHHHPFTVMGTQHILKHLRDLGYETFPEMFDESYDNEPNNIKRMLMVIDEVEKFCNLSKEEKDYKYSLVAKKLKHNHNLFYLRNQNDKRFVNLFNYIKLNGSA